MRVFDPGQIVKTAAANNPQNGLGHDGLPRRFILTASCERREPAPISHEWREAKSKKLIGRVSRARSFLMESLTKPRRFPADK
jgi:hypothetical protein